MRPRLQSRGGRSLPKALVPKDTWELRESFGGSVHLGVERDAGSGSPRCHRQSRHRNCWSSNTLRHGSGSREATGESPGTRFHLSHRVSGRSNGWALKNGEGAGPGDPCTCEIPAKASRLTDREHRALLHHATRLGRITPLETEASHFSVWDIAIRGDEVSHPVIR